MPCVSNASHDLIVLMKSFSCVLSAGNNDAVQKQPPVCSNKLRVPVQKPALAYDFTIPYTRRSGLPIITNVPSELAAPVVATPTAWAFPDRSLRKSASA